MVEIVMMVVVIMILADMVVQSSNQHGCNGTCELCSPLKGV